MGLLMNTKYKYIEQNKIYLFCYHWMRWHSWLGVQHRIWLYRFLSGAAFTFSRNHIGSWHLPLSLNTRCIGTFHSCSRSGFWSSRAAVTSWFAANFFPFDGASFASGDSLACTGMIHEHYCANIGCLINEWNIFLITLHFEGKFSLLMCQKQNFNTLTPSYDSPTKYFLSIFQKFLQI